MKVYKCSVCGMIINENNLNINNLALPYKNQIDNIYFCPFCGVSKEYFITVNEEALRGDKKTLNDKTFKILDHAMKLEVFNGEFYEYAARNSKDKKISVIFKQLSNIEIMHANIHRKLGGFSELPVLNKLDYSKYDNDKKLLELGKKREIHAVEYYKKYFNDVNDENIKNIFKALIEVEKTHIDLENKFLY